MNFVDTCITKVLKVYRKTMHIARTESKLLVILCDLINLTQTKKKSQPSTGLAHLGLEHVSCPSKGIPPAGKRSPPWQQLAPTYGYTIVNKLQYVFHVWLHLVGQGS